LGRALRAAVFPDRREFGERTAVRRPPREPPEGDRFLLGREERGPDREYRDLDPEEREVGRP
jgi:hypothetical protein